MSISEAVFAVVGDILACDRESLRADQHLFRDLRMDSDDASFMLVPMLRSRLGIDVPREAWREVNTIQEVIDLLARHE